LFSGPGRALDPIQIKGSIDSDSHGEQFTEQANTLMSTGFQTLQVTSSCTGLHLLLGARSSGSTSDSLELGLAGLIAEHEASGEPVTTVTLRLVRSEDAFWAQAALRWLSAHGRRVVLRTAKVLPKPLVMAARDCGATVVLEMAHSRLEVQRALLSPEADAAPALLLQAQHLRRLGIGVAVQLGPLVAGLHDRPGQIDGLVRHIAAADIHDVHLGVARLTPDRQQALLAVLDAEGAFEVQRRYGVTTSTGSWRLSALAANTLREGARSTVQSEGLVVDGCGCGAHCHLDLTERRAYVAVQGPELFAEAP
jgi:hypothetical protein